MIEQYENAIRDIANLSMSEETYRFAGRLLNDKENKDKFMAYQDEEILHPCWIIEAMLDIEHKAVADVMPMCKSVVENIGLDNMYYHGSIDKATAEERIRNCVLPRPDSDALALYDQITKDQQC